MAAHTQVFVDYFRRQFWGNRTGSSGPNSDPALTPLLRHNLRALFDKLQITSLVDAGCGDANLFRALVQEGAFTHRPMRYVGVDCVPELREENRRFFQALDAENLGFQAEFRVGDVVKEAWEKADLILSRDVLHYLPNALIQQFLDRCRESGARYLLVTHNLYSELSANSETAVGIFRPVNLTQAPFHWPMPQAAIDEDVYGKQLALFDLGEGYE